MIGDRQVTLQQNGKEGLSLTAAAAAAATTQNSLFPPDLRNNVIDIDLPHMFII